MTAAAATEPRDAVSVPKSPYVGLVPYEEADADFFFGRSTEAAIVAANLRATRLTIVYGPSGVGKSSLLMAGAVHRLRDEARSADDDDRFAVCVCRSWRDDPLRGLEEAARAALQESADGDALPAPAGTLAETLRAWSDQTGTLLVVFDQFEDYFQYHPDESDDRGLTGFAAELARIVNDPTLAVNVLLAIREDAWAKLDRFKGRIPSLFANYLRVDHLDLVAAREAIEGPIAAWNKIRSGSEGEPYAIEPALTDAVLEAASGGGLVLAAGSEAPAPASDAPGDRIEAPFLQLVLERLWRATVADGAHVLTVARLDGLGGARRIVENHLLDALARLEPGEQDAASDCFRFLVSSSRTKIAHSASDLAEWTQRPEPQLTAVLEKLCSGESGRILRAVSPGTDETRSPSYELFHDVLAEPILAWRRNHEHERSQRAVRRRFARVGFILLALAAGFAALGGWAVVSRQEAHRAAHTAASFAAASAARDLVQSHLDESLLLALEANRNGATADARNAMTLALEQARRSGVEAILHSGAVASLAFSRDGRTFATGGFDGTVRLWDLADRKALGALPTSHSTPVDSIAFSRDGVVLATGGDDGTVRLWDVADRRLLAARSTGRSGRVNSVAFSKDGRTLASGGDGKVQLWRVTSRGLEPVGAAMAVENDLLPVPVSVYSVAFSSDGRTLATGGDDGTVRLWNVARRARVGSPLVSGSGPLRSVAFSRNGRTLAVGGDDGSVRLWDVARRAPVGDPLTGDTGHIQSVAFSPDGRTLAVGGDHGTALWNVRKHTELGHPFHGDPAALVAVAFGSGGPTLGSAGKDGTVRLWRLTGEKSKQPSDFPLVRLWAVRPQRQVGQGPRGQAGLLKGVAFSPDGKTLASATADGTVRLWDVRTHRQLGRPLLGHAGPVYGVAFGPDGKTLASASADGTVRLWNVRTHRQLGSPLPSHSIVFAVAFSPDGATLASGSYDRVVRLWDVRTHAQVGQLVGHAGSVRSVAFSPDGNELASASWDKTVRLWDVRAQRQVGRPLYGHSRPVQAVAFSPGGTTLASADDRTVRLWDVQTHKRLGQPLPGYKGPLLVLAFSPDGSTLGAGYDRAKRLWQGIVWRRLGDLETRVCGLVLGNLTKAEWRDLLPPGIAYHAICPG